MVLPSVLISDLSNIDYGACTSLTAAEIDSLNLVPAAPVITTITTQSVPNTPALLHNDPALLETGNVSSVDVTAPEKEVIGSTVTVEDIGINPSVLYENSVILATEPLVLLVLITFYA